MAWLRDYSATPFNANSVTPPTFNSESGDLIIEIIQRAGTGQTWSTPSGYTAETNLDSGWGTTSVFSLVATGGDTPQNSTIGTAGDGVVYIYVIADPAPSTPIDLKQIDAASEQDAQAPNLSTSVNETLNIHTWIWNTGGNLRGPKFEEGLMWLDRPFLGTNQEAAHGWTYQKSSGSIARPTVEKNSSRAGHKVTLAIESSGAPEAPVYQPYSSPALETIHPLSHESYTNYGGAANDVTTELSSTIDGDTFNYNAPVQANLAGLGGINHGQTSQSSSTGSTTEHWGCGWDFTSYTTLGTNDIVAVGIKSITPKGGKSLADNGYTIGLRSSANNFRFWACAGSDSKPSLDGYSAFVFQPDSADYEIEEKGTFAPTTAITTIVAAAHKAIASGVRSILTVSQFMKVNTNILVGGNSARPATLQGFIDNLAGSLMPMVINQSGSSNNQYYSVQPLQIGNGTEDLNFAHPNSSLEFATSSEGNNAQYQVAAGSLGLTLYPVSGDTIDVSNMVIFGGSAWNFTIHASSNAAATTATNATTLIGVGTWDIGVDLGTFTGLTVSGCAEIDFSTLTADFDLSGGCTVTAGTATYDVRVSGATAAEIQADLDLIANCTVGSLIIDSTFAGDIAVSFDNLTVTSCHYRSSSAASTCTATMANNSSVSNTSVEDDETLTISNDKIRTFALSPTGGELNVVRTGTQTEEFNVETATASEQHTYTAPPGYNVDIQYHVPGYDPYWEANVDLGSTNATTTITLVKRPGSQN